MSADHLPKLASISALSLGRAVLTLEDGSNLTLSAEQDCPVLMGTEPFVLTTFGGEAARHYRVPAHLHATVSAALGFLHADTRPARLTLTGMDKQPDAVTFTAVNGEGQTVTLTMPRPVFVRPGFPMPRPASVPVNLSVTREDTPPGQGFTFQVYPETPEGRKVLDVLAVSAPLEASGEGEGQ